MVYNSTHVLLRFQGHFGGSSSVLDKWSAGVRLGIPGSGVVYDAAKLQTLVNSAATAANAFHAAALVAAGTTCFFDQVTGAQIGTTGRYTPDTQETIFSPYAPVAGAGTSVLPWNSASVISLRTGRPRGRCSNGRVYWPCLSMAIATATGRVSSANVTSRVSAAKTFLNALNTAGNLYQSGMRLVVASNVGLGDMAYVTSIRSDDRIDSIERRENDQPPVYNTQALD